MPCGTEYATEVLFWDLGDSKKGGGGGKGGEEEDISREEARKEGKGAPGYTCSGLSTS